MELLEKILEDRNLDVACTSVIKSGGKAGLDNMETKQLRNWLTKNRESLKKEIRERQYKPQPVLRVEIPKDDGSMRNLGIPTVIDRMVQQAVVQVLSPIYEEIFSETSYGFRPNRNAHMALEKALEYMNDDKDWVVDIDLEKFFDKVNHDKLMRIVSNTIKDGDVISLIRKFLISGVVIQGQYSDTKIGTPQGGNLSPLLSNIILDLLDKELESRGLSFTRYADDCLIFVKSEKSANRVMKNVTKFLEESLKLKVNMTKSRVRRPNELKYLGFGFYQYRNEYRAKVHPTSYEKLQTKVKRITSRSWGISMEKRLGKLRRLFIGWSNYFKVSRIYKTTIEVIEGNARFRLRMCFWKQWKTISKRFKSLKALGLKEGKAWEFSNTRKSYARVAISHILTTTLTNDVLETKGYLSLGSLI